MYKSSSSSLLILLLGLLACALHAPLVECQEVRSLSLNQYERTKGRRLKKKKKKKKKKRWRYIPPPPPPAPKSAKSEAPTDTPSASPGPSSLPSSAPSLPPVWCVELPASKKSKKNIFKKKKKARALRQLTLESGRCEDDEVDLTPLVPFIPDDAVTFLNGFLANFGF